MCSLLIEIQLTLKIRNWRNYFNSSWTKVIKNCPSLTKYLSKESTIYFFQLPPIDKSCQLITWYIYNKRIMIMSKSQHLFSQFYLEIDNPWFRWQKTFSSSPCFLHQSHPCIHNHKRLWSNYKYFQKCLFFRPGLRSAIFDFFQFTSSDPVG